MHVKPGKGSAFVRSKLKNYLTKATNEKTFARARSCRRRMSRSAPCSTPTRTTTCSS